MITFVDLQPVRRGAVGVSACLASARGASGGPLGNVHLGMEVRRLPVPVPGEHLTMGRRSIGKEAENWAGDWGRSPMSRAMQRWRACSAHEQRSVDCHDDSHVNRSVAVTTRIDNMIACGTISLRPISRWLVVGGTESPADAYLDDRFTDLLREQNRVTRGGMRMAEAGNYRVRVGTSFADRSEIVITGPTDLEPVRSPDEGVAMKERLAEIRTPDGKMKVFITHPEQGGPFPAVILYMDFWGTREELFDIARRIGTVGYYCMVPDFYYRQGDVHIEFRNAQGKMTSLNRLDEATQKKILAPLGRLTNAMVVADTGTLLEFIARGEPVSAGAKGSVGFCMGGRHVMCVAAHFPEYFRASASLHGSYLVSDLPDSPHRLVDKIKGELYCGFAELDPYTSPETAQTLADSMHACPVEFRYEVHRGAEHGYSLPERDIHHKQAANRDWELVFAMFQRRIPPYRA